MSHPPEPPVEEVDAFPFTAARTLLVLALLCFLYAMIFEEGWSVYPDIFEEIMRGGVPSGEEAVVVSGLCMLAVTALAPPFILRWLRMSRLLTRLLRLCSAILAVCFWFFLLRYGAYSWEILLPLALSPTFTFAGLCVSRPLTPAESAPH